MVRNCIEIYKIRILKKCGGRQHTINTVKENIHRCYKEYLLHYKETKIVYESFYILVRRMKLVASHLLPLLFPYGTLFKSKKYPFFQLYFNFLSPSKICVEWSIIFLGQIIWLRFKKKHPRMNILYLRLSNLHFLLYV